MLPSSGSGADSVPAPPDRVSQATPVHENATPSHSRGEGRSPRNSHAPAPTSNGTEAEMTPACEAEVSCIALDSHKKYRQGCNRTVGRSSSLCRRGTPLQKPRRTSMPDGATATVREGNSRAVKGASSAMATIMRDHISGMGPRACTATFMAGKDRPHRVTAPRAARAGSSSEARAGAWPERSGA